MHGIEQRIAPWLMNILEGWFDEMEEFLQCSSLLHLVVITEDASEISMQRKDTSSDSAYGPFCCSSLPEVHAAHVQHTTAWCVKFYNWHTFASAEARQAPVVTVESARK